MPKHLERWWLWWKQNKNNKNNNKFLRVSQRGSQVKKKFKIKWMLKKLNDLYVKCFQTNVTTIIHMFCDFYYYFQIKFKHVFEIYYMP